MLEHTRGSINCIDTTTVKKQKLSIHNWKNIHFVGKINFWDKGMLDWMWMVTPYFWYEFNEWCFFSVLLIFEMLIHKPIFVSNVPQTKFHCLSKSPLRFRQRVQYPKSSFTHSLFYSTFPIPDLALVLFNSFLPYYKSYIGLFSGERLSWNFWASFLSIASATKDTLENEKFHLTWNWKRNVKYCLSYSTFLTELINYCLWCWTFSSSPLSQLFLHSDFKMLSA